MIFFVFSSSIGVTIEYVVNFSLRGFQKFEHQFMEPVINLFFSSNIIEFIYLYKFSPAIQKLITISARMLTRERLVSLFISGLRNNVQKILTTSIEWENGVSRMNLKICILLEWWTALMFQRFLIICFFCCTGNRIFHYLLLLL